MTGIPDVWGSPLFHALAAACAEAGQLHTAYEQTGRLRDLESAVHLYRAVLDHAHNVDVRSTAANGLGTALWSRYERFGELRDLDDANVFADVLREDLTEPGELQERPDAV